MSRRGSFATCLLAAYLAAAPLPRTARAEVPPVDGPVPELREGLPLQVSLLGGQTVQGAFATVEGEVLRLATPEGVLDLPFALVTELRVDGQPYPPEAFLEGVRRWSAGAASEARSGPPPVLVGVASALWAGGGPALLGQWRSCLAYSAVESCLIGAGAIMVARGQYGPLLPLAALDVLLHAWSGAESVTAARRQRRRARALGAVDLALGVGPGGGGTPGLTLGVRVGSREGAGVLGNAGPGALGACSAPGLTEPCPFPY